MSELGWSHENRKSDAARPGKLGEGAITNGADIESPKLEFRTLEFNTNCKYQGSDGNGRWGIPFILGRPPAEGD